MLSRAPFDLQRIMAVLKSITGQLDLKCVVQAVSTAVIDILPHDHIDVALMNADRTIVSTYEAGLHTEWDIESRGTRSVAVSPIRTLFMGETDSIITDDAQADPRFHFEGAWSKPIFDAGLRGRLHVPVLVEGRIIGALSFSTQAPDTYSEADLDNARIVADILAAYMFALQQSELARRREVKRAEAEARAEGLRIGARHLTEELENSRQAIGMDLHDQTLADLSRISRNLKRLEGKTNLRGSELQPIQDDISHCLTELRVIIDNARPSVLQFFGFSEAIEAVLDRYARASAKPLVCRLRDEGCAAIDALPANTQVALYRIVQEAINNAVRHSGASTIEVQVFSHEAVIRITIVDDGCGLPQMPGKRTGGLANMRTRASLIEAELTVTSGAEGIGTQLSIAIPLARQQEPARIREVE
ncbi:GAF sensor signal transduction histidine kinase [uncultured Pleomorphomonas sp.]|uniref:histidine kinase n=1 Tax=uncultured Pleomorphomonas sp. TaxID=442121 RepID=A0A212LH64_9HYPH|nr:GAF domain-containing sensor histidine kinase [uncultured Pleomorphomonas sp.]SCM76830.1 GAF sensor signal transduction histidine kinase [uncultured Pleomorphomonas sp.]